MNLPPDLLPAWLLLAAHALLALVVAVAVRTAPWRSLAGNGLEHVFGGALVALALLWSLEAGVQPGLGFHFLGVTVLTLMFGWSLASVGTVLVGLLLCLLGRGELATLGIDLLLTAVLPVTVSHYVQRLVTERLPHNPFIYIFLGGFAGAIVAGLATVLALSAVLVASGGYAFGRIASDYLPFLPLYLFPEGLMNGMLTSVFVGMRPGWLRSYDEDSYLKS